MKSTLELSAPLRQIRKPISRLRGPEITNLALNPKLATRPRWSRGLQAPDSGPTVSPIAADQSQHHGVVNEAGISRLRCGF